MSTHCCFTLFEPAPRTACFVTWRFRTDADGNNRQGKEGSMPVTLGAVGLWVFSRLLADDIGGIAAELEELGFGALWLGGASPDLELVSKLLQASERLVVVTGIVSIWTESPATLASNVDRVATQHPDRF